MPQPDPAAPAPVSAPASPQSRLAQLRAQFVAGLPAREAEIEDLAATLMAEGPRRATIESLYLAVHKLAGIAGTYGLTQLGARAVQAEALLDRARARRPGERAMLGILLATDRLTEELRRAAPDH